MLLRLGHFMAAHGVPAAGGGNAPCLADTVSGVIFQLDAALAASHDGASPTWDNLVASPASGEARGAYDFYCGTGIAAASDDPSFNGPAGSAAAYWSMDGGDYFDAAGACAYLRDAHRTDASRPLTLGFLFRTPGTLAQSTFLSTTSASTAHGFRLRIVGSNGSLGIVGTNGSGAFNNKGIAGAGAVAVNTDYLLMFALDSGSPGGETYWLNSAAGASWTQAYAPGESTVSAPAPACVGAINGSHATPALNGMRFYGVFALNEIIDNSKAATIISYYEALHGRDYTP